MRRSGSGPSRTNTSQRRFRSWTEFHVKQHLSDVAKSLYGATRDLAHPSARARHDEWDTGNLDAVLTALRGHALHNDEARTCIDYLERNLERMDYPAFRAAGPCTSTGVVEASCKVAIGTRCKRADPRVKPLEVENRRLQRQLARAETIITLQNKLPRS